MKGASRGIAKDAALGNGRENPPARVLTKGASRTHSHNALRLSFALVVMQDLVSTLGSWGSPMPVSG